MKQIDYLIFGIIILGLFFISGISGCIQECGIENCHGLDIKCGPNIPDFCTEIYKLGDFCREFASCEIIEGQCQLIKGSEFDECKACVEKCDILSAEEAFDCENDCRRLFEVKEGCVERDGSCCLGEDCNMVLVTCVEGTYPKFLGCDENCMAIATCETEGYCESDEDCVAATCCHPTQCVLKEYAPDCSNEFCTLECKPGTMDCGQGSCKCVSGKCKAVFE